MIRRGLAGIALGALAFGVTAIDAGATTPSKASRPAACTAKGRLVTVGGQRATAYCGTAKATARVGGTSMTFRNGTCVWGASSFQIHLGTIHLLAGSSVQREPAFTIYASGYPVAKALVEIYWRGRAYVTSTLHATARPSANRSGGTFAGRIGKTGTGPAISGTVTCA
jgi:hypothetical protein